MKERRVSQTVIFVLLLSLLLLSCAGCGGDNKADKPESLLLSLSFDEGSGNQVTSSAGVTEAAELAYNFTNAAYMENRDPEWRAEGVQGGCLLFDGNSNYISYAPETLSVEGEALTVSVWVAPRAFEWDDPNAAANGTENLTAIVGQYSKDKKQGFILGYERYGRLCFQAGTGEEWLTLWADNGNLNKYEWNHVAAVFDGKAGTMALYLNGSPVGEKSITAGASIAPAGSEKLLIGKNAHGEAIAAGSYQMFSGYMDELKLYGKVLSQEEIAESASIQTPEISYSDIGLQNILTTDIYKTQFHGGPYQHWMNEPHAPVYYNGMYHLFFQQNMVGTYWRNISWGHLVSEDMVSWRPVKEAITPVENSVVPDGVWSGGAALDVNGVPVLFFTAGNDSFAKVAGLISNQNVGAAYPADLKDPELTEWVVCDELAVAQVPGQGRPGEFRDSHIWKEGDTWYMLICGGSETGAGGAALLYETKTLEVKGNGKIDMDWTYRGSLYDWPDQSMTYGTSWELPILLPLTNEAGTITKYFFCISPAPASLADNNAYYFVGNFDKETGKFIPDPAFDKNPALLDYGSNVFTGPSALVDPVSGNTYLFSIMQDQRTGAEEGAAGWAHCVGLARRIWLNDEGTDVKMAPIEALRSLEGEVLAQGTDLTLDQANALLAGVSGDLLHLRITADVSQSAHFTINVKGNGDKDITQFEYVTEDATVCGLTRNKGKECKSMYVDGPLAVEDGVLTADIYIDRSLVEVFFNDSKSISIRSYAAFDSQSIALESAAEVTVKELYVAEMKSIYT